MNFELRLYQTYPNSTCYSRSTPVEHTEIGGGVPHADGADFYHDAAPIDLCPTSQLVGNGHGLCRQQHKKNKRHKK